MSNKLQVGNIVNIGPPMDVYSEVPSHFLYHNRVGDWSLSKGHIKVSDFPHMIGKYVVVEAKLHGGGTGHGPHDIYPDGWHVVLEKMDNDWVKVDFYQSGSFTCVHRDVEVVGNAKMTWSSKNE